MNRPLLMVAVIATATASLLLSPPAPAQEPPPAKQANRVHITQGPALESAQADSAIITWTSNNPGGSDEHYGLVHYGTDPKNLSQTAKSHIRLNPAHSYTVFRVEVDASRPRPPTTTKLTPSTPMAPATKFQAP